MKNISILFCSLIILICFGSENLSKAASHTIKTGKIALIYSYDLSETASNAESERLEYFKKNYPSYRLRSFLLNANSKTQPYQLNNSIQHLKSQLDQFKPDYIITVDAPAFEYYYVPYIAKQKNTHGIFLNVPDYVYNNVYTHYNLDQFKKYICGSIVENNFSKIEELLYNNKKFIQKVYILKANTPEDNLLTQQITSQTKISTTIKDVNSLEDLKSVLRGISKSDDSLIVTTFKSLKYADKNRLATDKEIVELFKIYNNKSMEISFSHDFSKEGMAASYVNKYEINDSNISINKLIGDKLKKQQPKTITMNSQIVMDGTRFSKLLD